MSSGFLRISPELISIWRIFLFISMKKDHLRGFDGLFYIIGYDKYKGYMEKLIYYDCSNIVMACQQLFQYIVRQIQSIEFSALMSALMSSLIYPCLLVTSESQLRMSASVFFDSLRYMPLVLSLHHLD